VSLRRLYPKQPLVGIGAVIVCESKILLEKRKNEPGRGKWSIPGGLVDLGEHLEQSVIREVKEETQLNVYDPELIDAVDNVTVDDDGKVRYHFVIIDYFVKLKGGTIKASSDAEELQWTPFEEVENHVLTETFREFFVRNRSKLEEMNSC